MSNTAVVFLGVIALSSLVQAIFLMALAIQGRKLGRRLDEMERRFEDELRPTLRNMARLSQTFAEVGDIVGTQARRVDAFMADTILKMEEATTTIREVVLRPLGPIVDITAILKGFRKGLEIYKRLGGFESERKGGARRYADDEHLFI
jgi:hypothetical protein